MKMASAFVQPCKLEAITANLEELPGLPGITVGSVRGFGRGHVTLSPEHLEGVFVVDAERGVRIATLRGGGQTV